MGLQILAGVCLAGAVFCLVMGEVYHRRSVRKARELLVWMEEHREALERSYGPYEWRMKEAFVRAVAEGGR